MAQRKVNFTWELKNAGWKWEASHYEGNGIFFGKVSSPFVPSGELGTWYLWEILQNGAVLTKGSQADVLAITSSKQSQKAMKVQKQAYTTGELFGSAVPSNVKDIFNVKKETGVWD